MMLWWAPFFVVTILSERRKRGPWGLEGGGNGKPGLNQFNNLDYPAKPRWPLDENAAFLKGAGVQL